MAPEQVKGKRGDARTDIYSLGAILYEMLTGHQPFEGETPLVVMNARLIGDPAAPRKLNAALTPQVEEIVLHAMEREPSMRFGSAAEMKAELDAPGEVVVTGRAERLQTPSAWTGRWQRYRMVVLAVILPLIVVIAFALLALLGHRPQ
jgi:serine/threonine-protein kinase